MKIYLQAQSDAKTILLSAFLFINLLPIAHAQTPDSNKCVVSRYFDEVINKQQVALVPELFSAEFIYYDLHDFTNAPATVTSFQKTLRGFFIAFPDAHYTVENILAEGDKVFAQITLTATHRGDFMGMPASNNKLNITEMYLLTLKSGRITESRRLVDFGRFFSQIAGK